MAAGGTITDSGRFTAGTQPGVYQVTATLMQGRVASTAIVSISATGVEILPGQNIQSIVDASPQGTVFILKSGVHRRQTVRPKSGMSFIGETGTVMDGENVAAHAFETLASNPSNVTIRGLVITRYAPPSQFGAIQGDNGTNWLVEDNEISFNANHGLRPGPGMHIVNNFIHHNGVVGINGFRADNVIIEDNEVADNGTAIKDENPATAEAAGIKFLKQNNLVIRNNDIHDNARGIWIDTAYLNTQVVGNRVVDSRRSGIYIEATYGAVVTSNTVERNGFDGQPTGNRAGIQVVASPNVEISGNTVANNALGITATQSSGYPVGPYGPLVVDHLFVHDNTVVMATGWIGVEDLTGDATVFTTRNNHFERNSYQFTVGSLAGSAWFRWAGQTITAGQWQAAGQDRAGKFLR